jgi:hypothetical protein
MVVGKNWGASEVSALSALASVGFENAGWISGLSQAICSTRSSQAVKWF